MKVFTHYSEVPGTDGEGVRWRTILQFGGGWEIRGTVVMKNPGAADFRDPARRAIFDPELLCHLAAFDDDPNPTINDDPGSVFECPTRSNPSTMPADNSLPDKMPNHNTAPADNSLPDTILNTTPADKSLSDKMPAPDTVHADNPLSDTIPDPNTAWYEFNADATMRAVGALFSEYYALRGERLDGIIQIFNLFYIRGVNLGKALRKSRALQQAHKPEASTAQNSDTSPNNSMEYSGPAQDACGQCLTPAQIDRQPDIAAMLSNMAQYDIAHLVAPVYLGFAGLSKDKTYGPVARQFFEAAKALGMNYLDPDFERNDFTHPLYLMNYGRNKPASTLLRTRFLRNSLEKNF